MDIETAQLLYFDRGSISVSEWDEMPHSRQETFRRWMDRVLEERERANRSD